MATVVGDKHGYFFDRSQGNSLKSSNIFATPKHYQKSGGVQKVLESVLNSGSKLEVEECSNISEISYGDKYMKSKNPPPMSRNPELPLKFAT